MLVARTKDTAIDLSALEWKKQHVTDKQLMLQQCKNIRTNKCILAHILRMQLLENDRDSCYTVGMDWHGNI